MGTVGATRLCGVILGFLLLQGLSSQPTTVQSSSPQGSLSSFSLTTELTSSNTGVSSSSKPASSRPLPSTETPAARKGERRARTAEPSPHGAEQTMPVPSSTAAAGRSLQLPTASSKAEIPWSSTMDGPTASLLDLTQSHPQRHTPALDTSQGVTPKSVTTDLQASEDMAILPSPTSETVLTVAAFGVISFIAILVVVVIILVSVVSLRFKCRKNKESEDAQKPGSAGLSESCSTANAEKDSITLLSMKNINMNNSTGGLSAEKVL